MDNYILKHKVFLLSFTVFFAIVFCYINVSFQDQCNDMFSKNKQTYFVVPSSNNIPVLFGNILQKHNITPVSDIKCSNLVLLSNLDDFPLLSNITNNNNIQHIYGLKSVNMLASKPVLAMTIRAHLKCDYTKYIPKTWIITSKKDKNALLYHMKQYPNKPYVLKKNLQRQTGIQIITTQNDFSSISNEYNVCQELLLNPFIVSQRKINCRVYMLIFIEKAYDIHAYIYNDGFMYYTPKHFSRTNFGKDCHITTGYIDRKVYEENPLTIQDFYKWLDTNHAEGSSNKLKQNIRKLFTNVMNAYKDILDANELEVHRQRHAPNKFVIMGCDVAPDEHLNVKLMEINKGPELKQFDKRDGELKHNMVLDAFNICKVVNNENHKTNFIKVY